MALCKYFICEVLISLTFISAALGNISKPLWSNAIIEDQNEIDDPLIVSAMNWNQYHNLSVIYDFLHQINNKFPQITRVDNIGVTVEGRDIKVLRISADHQDGKTIFIEGGIHPREWISPSTATFVLNELVTKWHNLSGHLKNITWYIMPVANPDGYVYSQEVDRFWRKNRAIINGSTCRGVDLNRNFNVDWGASDTSNDPCAENFGGNSAFSEPETLAISNFLYEHRNNLEAYLTFHSYDQVISYPWAYKPEKDYSTKEWQRICKIAANRIEETTGKTYKCSSTYESYGSVSGVSTDWARAECDVKYPYVIELRDMGEYGFFLPPSQIIDTGKEGLIVVEAVADVISSIYELELVLY
ncbi:PREDICTED: carboxypeptidase B-like [Rhagoletis zephyria]|uniref:carboxypeptidase B-like n=1 Tax=Rhagoletis zephyria TaxID=28612 RepID=UPI000811200D|nr:PREDICTED: carboxypeptidase B-like [Rhagoletis zephyria]